MRDREVFREDIKMVGDGLGCDYYELNHIAGCPIAKMIYLLLTDCAKHIPSIWKGLKKGRVWLCFFGCR